MLRLRIILLSIAGLCADVKAETPVGLQDVRLAGSSSVAPYSMGLGNLMKHTARIYVSETGTGAGFSALCGATGVSVDAVGASRPISVDERMACRAHGIDQLVEVTIGLDAIVMAHRAKAKPMGLTARDIYLAVARNIPRSENECVMVSNRHRQWSDVRSDLPSRNILVIGPPSGSATRELMIDMIMREGARTFPCLQDVESRSPAFFEAALELRGDGVWVDGGENDHAIAHTLKYVQHAVGVFGFAHLSADPEVAAIAIDGVLPSRESILEGTYRYHRPLYLYAPLSRLQQRSIVAEALFRFSSPEAIAQNGALTRMGLIAGEDAGQVVQIDTVTGDRVPLDGGLGALRPPELTRARLN